MAELSGEETGKNRRFWERPSRLTERRRKIEQPSNQARTLRWPEE